MTGEESPKLHMASFAGLSVTREFSQLRNQLVDVSIGCHQKCGGTDIKFPGQLMFEKALGAPELMCEWGGDYEGCICTLPSSVTPLLGIGHQNRVNGKI